MKPRTYFYNSLTRHRPTKSPQSPRERSLSNRTPLPSPRASDETPNLSLQFANAASPGENSPATARPTAFQPHVASIPRASDEARNLFLQSINVASPLRTSQTAARTHEAPACFFAGAFRVMRERVSKFTGNAAARKSTFQPRIAPIPRVGDETPNLFLQFANAASPGENPPVTARLPVFSRAPLPSPRASDEAPNLFLQSANASSHPPAPLRARPIIETTRRHRLRGLSRAIAKRRPWRKIAGNRPARGFQNFSIECSIFVHKKAKMGGYTVSIETKGGNGL